MDLGLRGKVAAVAAASKGLGRACAEEFAREGCDVAIIARGQDALDETAGVLRAHGARVHTLAGDLTQPEVCERFIAETVEVLGGCDIVVPNAGGPPLGGAMAHDDETYRAAVELNLLTTVRLTRAALPHMRAKGWGRIVTIQSRSVKQPVDGLALSNTARAAVAGFCKTLATEVAHEGITVNVVAPGAILTDRIRSMAQAIVDAERVSFDEALERFAAEIPLGRVGRAEELAALVAFLASDRASFITGTTIQVDGGTVRSLL